MNLKIGVLSLQGDIEEHVEAMRRALSEEGIEGEFVHVKRPEHLEGLRALLMPGGESTVMGWLSLYSKLHIALKDRIGAGLPTLASCAGAILLSKRAYDRVVGQTSQPLLDLLDVLVERNAFGRQRDSFEAEIEIPVLGPPPYRAVFIRSPIIRQVGGGVTPLAKLPDGSIVALEQGSILATTFHPELSQDSRLHRYFIRKFML
jgi:5'-phosphate synthase pdxT subunit